MDAREALEAVLRRLDGITDGLRSSPYAQAHPIAIGRTRLLPIGERGETELLNVPSFPMRGRTWAVQVQITNAPELNAAGLVCLPQFSYLFLRVRWTQGSAAEFTVDLDLTSGGLCFPVVADSLRISVVNECPAIVPAFARDVTIMSAVGFTGSRLTAIPRRTVIVGEVKTGAAPIASVIPRSATQITVASVTPATQVIQPITIQFFDFIGTRVGSGYSPATSMPSPIDIPQGASTITLANTGPADAQASAIYRIGM